MDHRYMKHRFIECDIMISMHQKVWIVHYSVDFLNIPLKTFF